MARPRKEIGLDEFEKLCGFMCTEEEIASFFDVSVDTLQRWCKRTYGEGFAGIYKNKSAYAKCTLRRYQMQLAEKNPAMAIFLGKQWLGQKDVNTTDATVNINPMAGLSEEELRSLAKSDSAAKATDST